MPLNSHSLNHSSSVVPQADCGVEHAVVRDQALEAVGVAEDPVDHVSAVARAQRALAVLVDERIILLGVVEALIRSSYGAPPQSPLIASMNFCP